MNNKNTILLSFKYFNKNCFPESGNSNFASQIRVLNLTIHCMETEDSNNNVHFFKSKITCCKTFITKQIPDLCCAKFLNSKKPSTLSQEAIV